MPSFWIRLGRVHRRFGLLHEPFYQLIDGARWDVDGRRVETEADLLHYSNLVGGCVGAMMLPFLVDAPGDVETLEPHARRLGVAMQITNIVRDVGEDATVHGRTYLPARWLRQANVRLDDVLGHGVTDAYVQVLERAMHLAERCFEQSLPTVDALTPRVRPAIRGAARMYREILNEVRARDYDNVAQRAYVSLPRKLGILAGADYAGRRIALHGRTSPAAAAMHLRLTQQSAAA